MDPEVVDLCAALNRLTGVTTVESCCGHGKETYCIWFQVERLEDLPSVPWFVDVCHSGQKGWRVIVSTDCCMSPASFMLEGPVGAYESSKEIACFINTTVDAWASRRDRGSGARGGGLV